MARTATLLVVPAALWLTPGRDPPLGARRVALADRTRRLRLIALPRGRTLERPLRPCRLQVARLEVFGRRC